MNPFIIALSLTLIYFIVDAIFNKILDRPRKCFGEMFFWFWMIYTAALAGKAYCDEVVCPSHQVQFYLEKLEYTPQSHQIYCKFIPRGTPDYYVNEDGTPSDYVWRQVKGCDRRTAYASKELHREKSLEYFRLANSATLFLPQNTTVQHLRSVFLASMATIPAQGVTKILRVCPELPATRFKT